MIKVRFAPSPTGNLHIGGARTALFSWLYARAQGGTFVLRIEDTDRQRSKEEFLTEIMESMRWLGLSWEEFYKQSDRFELYRQYARQLVDEDKAYQEGEAVLLRMPRQEVRVYDLIRGEIVFDTEILKDEVLMKSDGSPTYSFACVVDDALMEITHVIRGEDHISNTPKQIMIYQALGFKVPKFAHLPLILDEEGGRMSKRTGAVAVSEYRRQGYLPQALVNYLLLLGWSPGNNQEKIDLAAAIKRFSIKKVQRSGAVFSLEKLRWLNGQYIKDAPTAEIADGLVPFLRERGYLSDNYDRKWLENIVQLYQSRMPTLMDFLERADYLFTDDFTVDTDAVTRLVTEEQSGPFSRLRERLSGVADFSAASVEQAFRGVVEDLGLEAADLVHPVRVALTGKTVGPGLFETMSALGKQRTLARLVIGR